ncbi:hypothetical protein EV368DRAFT_67459 [Lentinula lateritia]|nr:hypothetical protein EV368DRAFT_67459 [Lentinula lateritia]
MSRSGRLINSHTRLQLQLRLCIAFTLFINPLSSSNRLDFELAPKVKVEVEVEVPKVEVAVKVELDFGLAPKVEVEVELNFGLAPKVKVEVPKVKVKVKVELDFDLAPKVKVEATHAFLHFIDYESEACFRWHSVIPNDTNINSAQ